MTGKDCIYEFGPKVCVLPTIESIASYRREGCQNVALIADGKYVAAFHCE